MKYIICDRNIHDRGKSTALLKLTDMVKAKYGSSVTSNFIEGTAIDYYSKVTIDGVKVAIITMGDPCRVYFDVVTDAADVYKADVIICASRTSGYTVEHIDNMRKLYGYRVVWLSNPNTGYAATPTTNETDIFSEAFSIEVDSIVKGLYGIPLI